MPATGREHGFLAGEIYHHFLLFDPERNLGTPTVESQATTHWTTDTVLVARCRLHYESERAPLSHFPRAWVPTMPDIAVEVKSPNDSSRRSVAKAAIYLRRETQLVWIIIPDQGSAEVCRLDASGEIQTEFIGEDGSLSGDPVLPGFRLELSALFS